MLPSVTEHSSNVYAQMACVVSEKRSICVRVCVWEIHIEAECEAHECVRFIVYWHWHILEYLFIYFYLYISICLLLDIWALAGAKEDERAGGRGWHGGGVPIDSHAYTTTDTHLAVTIHGAHNSK